VRTLHADCASFQTRQRLDCASASSRSHRRKRQLALSLFRAAACVAVLHTPLAAQVLVATPKGVVVAHDRRIELGGVWKAEGVRYATAIAASADRVVVLDAIHNEAVILDLAGGRAQRIRTAETPVAASFVDGEIYILARDGGVVHRVGKEDLQIRGDLLRRDYVYSRATGVLQKIGGPKIDAAPFASDLEIDGNIAYLTYPREAKVRTIDLTTKQVREVSVGAVPVDLAFAGGGTALTARILAVADPSAKRVWMTEATQSTAEAVARGFVRGLLGLGLFGARDAQFPTGVDRVETRGRVWIAYDSSSGTLYHFTKRQSTVLARGVAPQAFALTANGVAWWNGTSVAQKSFR
jgi:hypothetical protein